MRVYKEHPKARIKGLQLQRGLQTIDMDEETLQNDGFPLPGPLECKKVSKFYQTMKKSFHCRLKKTLLKGGSKFTNSLLKAPSSKIQYMS